MILVKDTYLSLGRGYALLKTFYLPEVSFGGNILPGVGNNHVKGKLSILISLEMRAFETYR